MSDILDVLWKERNDLREKVKELENENEKLRSIEIIQEGAHISITIGDSDVFPIMVHKQPADEIVIGEEDEMP